MVAEVLLLLFLLSACDGSKTDDTGTAGECDTTNESCARGTCGGEGGQMLPGADCLACHSTGVAKEEEDEDAPVFTIAGTAFTDATGTQGLSGATVAVTDFDGNTITLTTNAAGNFYSSDPVTLPIVATIESDSVMQEMTTPASYGGCNSCHACEGAAGGKLVP